MADYNLGSAHGEIVIKYDGSGAKQAQQDVENIDKKSQQVAKSSMTTKDAADKVATGMTIIGGAAVAGLTLAVHTATTFEAALSGVRAAGNASASEMDQLRNKALQLGSDTKFSATEAAGAMEALIKAGLSTNDVLHGAADAAVSLAAAERIDLTQAAEIAATAMTAFNLKASDLPKIADTISRAASATKMDVTDFAQAMNQAGAVSKLVGLSFDDMALAITAMGKAGIVGSDAGTSLKTMLMNLQPQTKQQRILMKELGLVTEEGANAFFDAHGKIKSMTEIAGVLQNALKGQTEQQKTLTLQTLFGSDAVRAAAIVAGEGADGMKKLTKEMNSQLSVSDKAKIQMDNFAGTMENFRGDMETAAINIGKILLPVLDKLVHLLSDLVGWFNKLPGPVKEVLTWGLAIGGMLLLIGGGTIKAIIAIMKLIEILKILKIAQLAVLLTNPWFLIAVAVAAAVALIIMYWDNIVKFLTQAWNFIRSNAIAIWNDIMGFITGVQMAIGQFFYDIWTSIVNFITTIMMNIGKFFYTIWTDITNFIVSTLTGIAYFFVNIWTSVRDFFVGLWNNVRDFFVGIWNNIISFLSDQINNVVRFFTELPGKILGAIGDFGRLLYDKGRDIINGLIRGIGDMVGSLMDKIRGIAGSIGNAFSSVLHIFSPSRVFAEYGKMTMEGYLVGVDNLTPKVIGTVEDIAANVALVGNPRSAAPLNTYAGSATGGDGASLESSGSTIVVQNLTLNVAGNLDPSNPKEFKKTIKSIHEGIENVKKESR